MIRIKIIFKTQSHKFIVVIHWFHCWNGNLAFSFEFITGIFVLYFCRLLAMVDVNLSFGNFVFPSISLAFDKGQSMKQNEWYDMAGARWKRARQRKVY